jgi:hypothetical protein
MQMPSYHPKELKMLSEVPRYIRIKHGPDFTRQTIYNWAKVGVRGTKLKTVQVGCFIRTTKNWVDEFLARLADQRAL